MILNQSQANAVYSAMCELNNVNAIIDISIKDEFHPIDVFESETDGSIHVFRYIDNDQRSECYETQAHFAATYGIV